MCMSCIWPNELPPYHQQQTQPKVGEQSMHLEIFKSFHKISLLIFFFLHRFSTNVSNKIMGGLLSDNGGDEDGQTPSWSGKG